MGSVWEPFWLAGWGQSGNSDSATGTILLSGATVESAAASDAASGTILLSGLRTEAWSVANATGGTIRLAGASADHWTIANTASGTILLSGTGSTPPPVISSLAGYGPPVAVPDHWRPADESDDELALVLT